MRGQDRQTGKLFSYLSPEALVPADHPLRAITLLVDAALDRLSGDFAALYASTGRPSIPPEKLLRALLQQAFYSVRSERQLIEVWASKADPAPAQPAIQSRFRKRAIRRIRISAAAKAVR